ncbi:hypothetical protein ACU4GA_29115 [Methylobacterium oryzae CBMB20]
MKGLQAVRGGRAGGLRGGRPARCGRQRPIGLYLYQKRLRNLDTVLCQVKVFPLEVRKQLKHFPRRASGNSAGSPRRRPPRPCPSPASPP